MKQNTKPKQAAVNATTHDNQCPNCGTPSQPSTATLRHDINGEPQHIDGIAHLACPRCAEKLISAAAVRQLQQAAIVAYRQRHGLLAAAEIRQLREAMALTQAELAQLLQLGDNTLSRWEAGRAAQTGAMDVLLRLVRDVPAARVFLQKRAA